MAATGIVRSSTPGVHRGLRVSNYINVPTQTVYLYCSNQALHPYYKDQGTWYMATVVTTIANSEHCVSGTMAFLKACCERFPYNHGADPRMYGAEPVGEESKSPEKFRGQITAIPKEAQRFILQEELLNIIVGCKFREVHALMAVSVDLDIDWAKSKYK